METRTGMGVSSKDANEGGFAGVSNVLNEPLGPDAIVVQRIEGMEEILPTGNKAL